MSGECSKFVRVQRFFVVFLYISGLKHAARERVQCGPPAIGKIKIFMKFEVIFAYFFKYMDEKQNI